MAGALTLVLSTIAAQVAPAPVEPPPRGEFDAVVALAMPEPTTPGFTLRGRLRLVADLWLHVGLGARAGSGPLDLEQTTGGGGGGRGQATSSGVREFPFEAGLGYRIPLGHSFALGVRGDAVLLSRRFVLSNFEPQHRWLMALRGGVEARLTLTEQIGLQLLVGAEGRLGRTEVIFGAQQGVFAPVAAYVELGPSIYF